MTAPPRHGGVFHGDARGQASRDHAASIDAFAQAFESDEPATMMRAFLERKR